MVWVKTERRTLSRCVSGVDWGTERDVVLEGPDGVRVVKTKGHTGWSGVGYTSYAGPTWILQLNDTYDGNKHLNRGYGGAGEGRVTNETWQSWLPKIAEAMKLRVEHLPQTLPRGGTLVWRDAEKPMTPEQAKKLWPEGTYRVKEDVPGPDPDARRDDWRRAKVIAAGTVLHVRHDDVDTPYPTVFKTWQHERMSLGRVGQRNDFTALGYALEPLPDTPSRFIRRSFGPRADRLVMNLLDRLAADKVLTVDQVKAAFDKLENGADE